MFGKTKQFLQNIDDKAEAHAAGVPLKGLQDDKPKRVKIPPPVIKKKKERPIEVAKNEAIIKMKHRKVLIQEKVKDEEAVVDFKKFKKKEIKKADADFQEKYGDEFDKPPTPEVRPQSSGSSNSKKSVEKEPLKID
jgi:isopropylmalate/homocitrate/citramalate synthase